MNARSPPCSRTCGSRRRSSSRSADTTSGSSSAPAAFRSSMLPFASSWNMYSLPVRFAGSPVQRSFDSTPNLTRFRAQDLEQRTQRLLEVRLERHRRSRATPARRASPDRTSRARPTARTSALVVAEAPDVAAPLEVVVHRAEIVGRVAVRDQPAARADQDRQVLDADRALVLAGAAGRALPEHLFADTPRRASVRGCRRAARPASAG